MDDNDPKFAALKEDLEKRSKERKRRAKQSQKEKDLGNACFKKKDYKAALQHYDKALEFRKDDKSLWTNHALVCLKLGNYKQTVEDCTRCLEYVEYIEQRKRLTRTEMKAFMRR